MTFHEVKGVGVDMSRQTMIYRGMEEQSFDSLSTRLRSGGIALLTRALDLVSYPRSPAEPLALLPLGICHADGTGFHQFAGLADGLAALAAVVRWKCHATGF